MESTPRPWRPTPRCEPSCGVTAVRRIGGNADAHGPKERRGDAERSTTSSGLDRKRKGKKLSNEDWTSPTDPDAKIAKMKNGPTRLDYKPEHALDLDTGVIVAAPIHPADKGDATTQSIPRLRRRRASWPTSALRRAPR